MRSNKKSDVYLGLRDDITSLTLYPGEELSIETLCSKYSVSRSPLRDALLRLERDKLVDIFPQKGTRVSFLNEEILEEERYMRKCMELGALKRALSIKRTPEEKEAFVTKLDSLLLMQKATLLEKDYSLFYKYDDEMHYLFYKEAGLLNVLEIISAHTANDKRIMLLSFNEESIVKEVLKDHQKIVEAIKKDDLDRAISLDEIHLERVVSEMKEFKKEFPSYFDKGV